MILTHGPRDDFGKRSFTMVWPNPGRQTWQQHPDPGPFQAQCFRADEREYVAQWAREGKRVLVLRDPNRTRYAEAEARLAPALAEAKARA